jgi:very-short-patch-repair endonuclease
VRGVGDFCAAVETLRRAARGRALSGFKFVRQEPIGPYFVDFVCRDEKLIVEIDGATHSTDEERRQDGRRTEFLQTCGYRVVPFANEEVNRNLDGGPRDHSCKARRLSFNSSPSGDPRPASRGEGRVRGVGDWPRREQEKVARSAG